jgi:hypothetical protein
MPILPSDAPAIAFATRGDWYLPRKSPLRVGCSGKQYRIDATARPFRPQSLARSPLSSFELHNSSRISPSLRVLRTSRECWSEEKDLRAAEDACSPGAARLAAGRRFVRALLKGVGAALLIAMVPLQGHAQNAARPNGFAALHRASHFGDRHPRDQQGPFGAPPSGLLKGACGLKGTASQRANAEQRCLSAALAYVVSPPPATRGVLPRYLPTISPKDAQPIPPVAAATPPRRPAWRQAGRVRRAQGHQCHRRQGARRLLAELPRPLHAQRAGSCRQERSARRLRFHRRRLCPRRCGGGRHAGGEGRLPEIESLPALRRALAEHHSRRLATAG